MARTIRNIVISVMVALLAACGGSDDSNTQLPSGISQGTWEEGDLSGSLYALSLENETQALSDQNVRMNINFSVSGNAVTGQGGYYFVGDYGPYSGLVSATGTLSGTSLTADITREDGPTDTVTLVRDDSSSDYEASFEKIAGVYQTKDQSVDIKFSEIGAISGTDGDNCKYSGDVEIPNAAVNVYQVTLNLASCKNSGNNGTYTGLATVDDSDSYPDYDVRILYGNDSRLAKLDLFK